MKPLQIMMMLLADPQVSVPAEVKIQVGRLATVSITSTGKITRYLCLDDQVDVFRAYEDDPGKISLRILCHQPGRYKLVVYTAADGVPSEPAVCTIIAQLGKVADKVTDKLPDTVVEPMGKFESRLLAGWKLERNLEARKKLADLYRRAAETIVPDESIKTAGGVTTIVAKAAGEVVGDPGKVSVGVRAVLEQELQSKLPKDPQAPLTEELRALIIAEFKRIADHLDKLP